LNTVDQLLADGQVGALDAFNTVEDPAYGRFTVPGTPFHMLGMGKPAARRPPRLGEHTREVLREAGYPDARIDALLKSGAVAEAPEA
jgi:crotonobetainyl-CoA:carnitine CoA-transferase CaiB-like acyl-CoA transferase